MVRKKSSAGRVKLSFCLLEFKKMIALLNSGMEFDEIKKLNLESNIFAAPTQARTIQMFNTISMRFKDLDKKFYRLLDKLYVSNQKLLILISIMASNTLFLILCNKFPGRNLLSVRSIGGRITWSI